ncbi:MAG: replication initiation protein [Janthinobacterium lividum]
MASSPYPGVSYDKLNGRWKARAKVDGRWVSAGYHATADLAHAAVQQAQQAAQAQLSDQTEPPLPDNHAELVERAQRSRSIAQHNLLVETPTTKTLLEAKVFALMLRSISKDESEPITAVIPLGELFPTGSFGGQQRQLLEDAMVRLMAASVRIPKLNEEDFHLVSLCDSIRLDSEKRLLLATFGRAVRPYLVNLVGNFTTADIDELLTIKSNSAHKLYWLMRSWQFKSPHTVTVEKLKALTTGEGYDQYADFRNKVLKPSVAELNELSFDITYTERRQRGRAVTDITFNIGRKENPVQLTLPLPAAAAAPSPVPLLSPLQQKAQTRLQKLKLTEAQTRKVLQVLGSEETQLTKLLKATFPVLRDFETKAKPGENVAASAMSVLKSEFPTIWAAEQPGRQ